ncbi:DUF2752 domain-containing protein [Cohnella herbarum]|uniref:DUF2752 domain-containing protein n=1 Tax=Cohnella herbarum TaxID=2728023 RepID=A0A7Z2ZQS6_9BACL|nr:DUF2752 domain-containing protein [Cohnella herbarum]
MNPKRRSSLIWGASLGVAGLLYLKVWLPLTHIGIPCPFRELTGLYCPGCGATRAILSLLDLDVHQAYRYNPLIFILLPLFALYFIAHKKRLRIMSNGVMAVMLILTLAFGLLRNIPAYAWLAPAAGQF